MLRIATLAGLVLAGLVLTAGGCATTINGPAKLIGEQLDAATALYGPWADQTELNGETTYIWRRGLTLKDGSSRFCELRVTLGFRNTIGRAYLQGYSDACRLFSVRLIPASK